MRNANQPLEHFLRIARRGRPGTGASGGEVRARKLALAIIEYSVGLDDQAIDGASDFLRLAPLAPVAARKLIDAPEGKEAAHV